MLIDFHTHIYPDKIAVKLIPQLSKITKIKSATDGTAADARRKMKEWGVDKSVVLHIATNPEKYKKVNEFALEINDDRLISFAAVHPLGKDTAKELARIKKAGLKGVKFHPEYQGYFITDERMYPIYDKCRELGLIMVFHAGKDFGFEDSLMAPVDAMSKLLDDFPGAKIVLAHMGGFRFWHEVLDMIAGKDCYLDTSFVAGHLPTELAEEIINKHGAEKILFGSDCPWMGVPESFAYIDSLRISAADKELIYYKNAERLLENI